MKYYIGSMQCNPNYLEHYGKKGMHWGERKYQNPDGSLTPEGREHYGVGERQETRGRDIYEKQQIRRMNRAYNKVSRLDRRIVGEGTARQNRKLEKARERYAEAQGNLDRYHNASDVEKRKARNSIRLKRAGMVAAGAALTAGIAAAALANNEIVKRTAPTIMKNLGSGKGLAVESAPVRDVVMKNLGSGKGWTPVDLTQRYITKYTYGRNAALAGGAAALLGGASLAANKNRTPMTKAEEERKKRRRDQLRRAARDFDGD